MCSQTRYHEWTESHLVHKGRKFVAEIMNGFLRCQLLIESFILINNLLHCDMHEAILINSLNLHILKIRKIHNIFHVRLIETFKNVFFFLINHSWKNIKCNFDVFISIKIVEYYFIYWLFIFIFFLLIEIEMWFRYNILLIILYSRYKIRNAFCSISIAMTFVYNNAALITFGNIYCHITCRDYCDKARNKPAVAFEDFYRWWEIRYIARWLRRGENITRRTVLQGWPGIGTYCIKSR